MFLFQPAEENGSGAKQLIDCGFDKVLKPDAFVGLHVAPKLNAGCIGLKGRGRQRPPPTCSRFGSREKAATGAHPENCVDPYYDQRVHPDPASDHRFQGKPSHPSGGPHRRQHPRRSGQQRDPGLCGYGAEPSEAWNRKAARRCRRPSTGSPFPAPPPCGARRRLPGNKGMPPLVNDTPIVDGIRAAAQKLLPADAIKTIADPSLGSEDFSYLFPAYGPGASSALAAETIPIPIQGMGSTIPKCIR